MLPLKVIVNGTAIYELKEKEPLIIQPTTGATVIEIINGFHKSQKLTIPTKEGTHFYQVQSRIDNVQLGTCLIVVLLFFAINFFANNRLFLVLANLPVLIILFVLYLRRNHFIQILPFNNYA